MGLRRGIATVAALNLRVKLKVCLAGEFAVGKTSLIRRYVYDAFDDRYIATVGAKVTKKELDIAANDSEESHRVVLTIWDIMGAKGLRELLKEAYFNGTQGILAVCDVTRPGTLQELDDWRKSIEKIAGEVPTYILANKVDLKKEAELGEEEVAAFAKEWGSPHLFTSAKTGENVEEAFGRLTGLILESQLSSLGA